jgi:hypothetical protein
MKLHEIVSACDSPNMSIDIVQIERYKKSLLTIYGRDAIVIVTDVFNAGSLGKVVSQPCYAGALYRYVDTIEGISDEDKEDIIEVIGFQSISLDSL